MHQKIGDINREKKTVRMNQGVELKKKPKRNEV